MYCVMGIYVCLVCANSMSLLIDSVQSNSLLIVT